MKGIVKKQICVLAVAAMAAGGIKQPVSAQNQQISQIQNIRQEALHSVADGNVTQRHQQKAA